jgi:hypothetical protein
MKTIHPIQKLAWVYTGLFLFVTSLGYLPGLTDANGVTLGLFSLQPIDDALHFGSAVWAACAAWWSPRASTLYFKIFGVIYGLDGVCGLLFGNGYLDLGIFNQGPIALDWTTKIFANLPHIIIGGLAAFIGFVVSRQFPAQASHETKVA